MRYVEFFGAPGAGKTTAVPEVMEVFGGQGFPAMTVEEALLPALRELALGRTLRAAMTFLPRTSLQQRARDIFKASGAYSLSLASFLAERGPFLGTCLHSGSFQGLPAEERRRAVYLFLETAAAHSFLSERKHDTTIVVDEGFLQRTMNFFLSPAFLERAVDSEVLGSYLDAIPLPALAFHISVDAPTCLARLQERPGRRPLRMHALPESDSLAFIESSIVHFGLLARELEKRGVSVVELPGHQDPAERTKFIKEGGRLLGRG